MNLTPEKLTKVMKKKMLTGMDVARATDLNYQTVYNFLKGYNVNFRTKRNLTAFVVENSKN